MLYEPENIVSDVNTAEAILKDGFKILLKTSKDRKDIEALVKAGYDIKRVDISECTKEEYDNGFGETAADSLKIDLD